jgi:peptidoglycan/LPS O-acetylase OafA/YrhL
MIICFLGIPVANDCLSMVGIHLGSSVMSQGFSGGDYGCYLISGYLLKKGVLKKLKIWMLSVFAFVSFGILISIQICSYYLNNNYSLWYNNLFLFICGVSLFEIVSRSKKICCEKPIMWIAKYSFAIYLVHNPINMLFTRYTSFITVRPLRVIVVWSVTVLLSLLVTVVIGKIPKLGRKVLYIR